MFKIETWVGEKFGGWFAGTDRYKTADKAQRVADDHRGAEKHVNATMMKRRVVPA